jgi:hypothetical protein
MNSDWLTFFGIIAASGATFGGLIFVALEKSYRAWANHRLRRLVGLRTLSEFLLPFLFSTALFIPPHDWHIPAILIAVLGIGLALKYRHDVKHTPDLMANSFDQEQGEALLPFLAYGLLIWAVVADLSGWPYLVVSHLTLVAIMMLVLFFVGWLEVWRFYMAPPKPVEDIGRLAATSSEVQSLDQLPEKVAPPKVESKASSK